MERLNSEPECTRSSHYFLKEKSLRPIFCDSCLDYNLATDNTIYLCQYCDMVFHSKTCLGTFLEENLDCEKNKEWKLKYRLIPNEISEWNTDDVLGWLYCSRLNQLHNYVYINKITGQQILSWSKNFSQTYVNVPPENYLLSFFEAIKVLNGKKERKFEVQRSTTISKQRTRTTVEKTQRTHNFQLRTVKINYPCDLCKISLIGTHKQCLFCTKCSLAIHTCCLVHRKFSKICIDNQYKKFDWMPKYLFSESTTDVEWLRKGFKYLEKFPERYFESFEKYPPQSHYDFIRKSLEAEEKAGIISKLGFEHMSAIVFSIYDYFLERPTKLISSSLYYEMMDLFEKKQFSELSKCMKKFSNDALEILSIILNHINCMSKHHEIDFQKVSKLYANYFIIPPLKEFINYPYIMEKHEMLFEELLIDLSNESAFEPIYEEYFGDVDVKRDALLELQNYYYDKMSRAKALEVMKKQTNGNYLVRKSTHKSNYILIVAYNNKGISVPINFNSDKYGIGKVCQFFSVADMITYYENNFINDLNTAIQTKLNKPIEKKIKTSRISISIQEIEELQKEREELLIKLEDKLINDTEEFNSLSLKLRCEITLQNMIKAQLNEIPTISFNPLSTIEKENIFKERYSKVEAVFSGHLIKVNEIDDKVYHFKLEIEKIKQEIESCKKNLESFDKFLLFLKEKEIGGFPLLPEEYYLPSMSRKDLTEKYCGQPHGTFLVRKSERMNLLLLCIINQGKILSIKIFSDKDGYCLGKMDEKFPSLHSLINFYYRKQIHFNLGNSSVSLRTPLGKIINEYS